MMTALQMGINLPEGFDFNDENFEPTTTDQKVYAVLYTFVELVAADSKSGVANVTLELPNGYVDFTFKLNKIVSLNTDPANGTKTSETVVNYTN